jgi:hypothetical protein
MPQCLKEEIMGSQIQKAVVLLAVAVILGGCASVEVSQDYDPLSATYHHATWQWETPAQPETGDLRVDNPLLINRIRHAIESHLAARNITQTQQQPSLYVAYHLAIEPKLQSYATHSPLGMGGYFYPWSWDYGTDTHVYQYDQCQLTIDIKAADTNTLIWRGTGVYRFRTYKTPEAAAAEMQRIVDRILAQFPPIQE